MGISVRQGDMVNGKLHSETASYELLAEVLSILDACLY